MKSLSVFILFTILLNCYVDSSNYYHRFIATPISKSKNASAHANKKVVPLKKIIPSFPKVNRKAEVKKDDLVCLNNGTNLGKIDPGNSCKSVFANKCQIILKRDPELGKKKIPAPIPKTVTTVNKKGKMVTKIAPLKKKKKWSLKARSLKFLKKRKSFRKLPKAMQKKILLEKSAKNFVKKKLANINLSKVTPKKIKKLSKKLTEINDLPITHKKARRYVSHTPQRPKTLESLIKLIKEKKPLPSEAKKTPLPIPKPKLSKTGNFCVHAVEWNLNYCCHYTNRDAAQSFANSQPPEKEFSHLIYNGYVAQQQDKERKAKKILSKISKALATLTPTPKSVKIKQRKANKKLKKAYKKILKARKQHKAQELNKAKEILKAHKGSHKESHNTKQTKMDKNKSF
jgi:hypothetical protein